MIGQNAAFSGQPPLAARLVASWPARCESRRRSADRSPALLFTSTQGSCRTVAGSAYGLRDIRRHHAPPQHRPTLGGP